MQRIILVAKAHLEVNLFAPSNKDPTFGLANKRIFVAGHCGIVGSALVRRLARENCEIVTAKPRQLDLCCQKAVERWLAARRLDAVFVPAARFGGMFVNERHSPDFLYKARLIETNLIHAAFKVDVGRLVVLNSAGAHPSYATKPVPENMLEHGGKLFAMATMDGAQLCDAYRRAYGCNFVSAIPANLYGPSESFDVHTNHILTLIRKFHEAKLRKAQSVVMTSNGAARCEFLYVDDCADALVYIMKAYLEADPIDVACGEDLPLIHLALLIAHIVGFEGRISDDPTKPDGLLEKVRNPERLRKLGWCRKVGLENGIRATYEWYLGQHTKNRPDVDQVRAVNQ